jgi:hypothetical protein
MSKLSWNRLDCLYPEVKKLNSYQFSHMIQLRVSVPDYMQNKDITEDFKAGTNKQDRYNLTV